MSETVDCLIFGGNSALPQLEIYAGPHRIATELRSYGYSVQVVDISGVETYEPLISRIINKFVGKNTIWIGFSTNFLSSILGYWYSENEIQRKLYHDANPNCDAELKKLIDHARQINPDVQFVVGGVRGFNLMHLGVTKLQGYVDSEIVAFTERCKARLQKVERTVTKDYKEFATSRIVFQRNDVFNDDRFLPIEISRGCMFKCKFCSFPLVGKKKNDYIRDYDIIRDEMIYNYETFGIDTYVFADDTYNESLLKLEQLYNKVFSTLPFKLSFVSYLRLDLLMRYPEMIGLLVDSGLKSAAFGIETLDPINAKLIGKGIEPMKQIEFVARLKQDEFKNVLCSSGFVLGLPNDTRESLERNARWFTSRDNPLDDWYPHRLSIVPFDKTNERCFYSEFDLAYRKHGYDIKYAVDGHFVWVNNKLTSLEVDTIALRIKNEKASLVKHGGFGFVTALNLGYSPNDIITLTKSQLNGIMDTEELIIKRRLQYFERLLAL